MKKLIFSAAVLASAFFAASCQQELLEPQAEGNTVTYTVEVPEVATKAIGDGNNVNQLIYAVYRVTGETEDVAKTTLQESELMYQKDVPVIEGKAIVPLELIKDQSYLVLFWAQVENKWFGVDYKFGTAGVRYPSTYVPNSDDYAAFSNVDYISVDGSVKKSITLTRPFGQLNIATNLPDPNLFTPVITGTQVTVEGAANYYDVATGKGIAGTLEFKSVAPITAESFPGYASYLSMNYVFVPDQQATVSVSYVITTESHGTVDNTISNVPVKKNYKTNIVGKLLTSDVDYNVTLEKEWADAGKDMVVLADGVVKNINDDYEITTAEGFAYAINNLFAEGGTFYIHPGTYNFTGLVVEPKPTKPGVILNVKANEIPVVTRSTPVFEIIGLDVAYLVSEVTNGSQAIFSNLVLPEDTKLVGTNNGVVGVSGCSNEKTDEPADLIGVNGQNGKVVNTVSMASVKEINDAIAQGLTYIELTGDITGLTEIFTISSPVTIDGCSHKLTSSAGRAINVSGADGVTIKNLVIECTGERAINIIQNATNVTIDNVTATAANYTVNVAASAPKAVVNIKNSTLNGLCTVNVSAESAKVTVDNSTINCNDNNTTAGEAYSALSLNREAVGGKIIATNTVVNVAEGSDSHKGRNGAENGEVTINGSTEEVVVMVAAIIYPNNTNYHAFVSLDGAIDFAQGKNGVITLIRNLTVAEPVIIEEDQTVVLDLNGKTLTGTMHKSVGHVLKNEGTLLIKNGTISSTGANGGSAIYNAGTLTVQNATLNGSSIRENGDWPSYPVNNYSDATLENVTVTGYQGAIAATAPGTTTVTNCTINKEYLNTSSHVFYINHADANVVVNGGTYTHKGMDGSLAYVNKGRITVNGGTFSASKGGYGMAASTGGSIEVNGGDFSAAIIDWGGTINIKGGTFASEPAKDHLADDYKAVKNAETGKWEVVEKTYVAQIGEKKYESLQEAFATVQDDQTIIFLSDVEQADGVILTDKNITVDLNGKTFTVSEGASTNNRNFKINGSSEVTIKNGTMIAAGELTSGAYGTVRTDGEAVVNLETVKLYSYRGYGLNVKANTGTKVNIKDSEIYSQYSGGVEAAGGEIELTNVKIEQRGVYSSAAWCSVAIGVNGGGKVTVKSGDYYAAAIATDSNAAQATWVAYVMSSGGILDIEGGTYNGVVAETASAANACGLICADRAAVVNIYDGIFNSNGAILDMRNNVGTQPNPVATLYGGNFSADPRVSGLYSSNLIKVAEGKEVNEGADGRWTIQ